MRLAIVVACLAACSGEASEERAKDPPPSLNIRLDVTSSAEAELAKRAAQVFIDECPKWLAHRYDVESAVARHRAFSGDDYPLRAFGWKRAIEIEIAVRQGTATFDEPVPGYAGHTFRYLLGGGASPGIVTSKDGAKSLCNIPRVSGEDGFRAVSSLSFL